MKKNTKNKEPMLDFDYRPHGFKDAEVDKKKPTKTKSGKKK